MKFMSLIWYSDPFLFLRFMSQSLIFCPSTLQVFELSPKVLTITTIKPLGLNLLICLVWLLKRLQKSDKTAEHVYYKRIWLNLIIHGLDSWAWRPNLIHKLWFFCCFGSYSIVNNSIWQYDDDALKILLRWLPLGIWYNHIYETRYQYKCCNHINVGIYVVFVCLH